MSLQLQTVAEKQRDQLLVPANAAAESQLVSPFATRRMDDPHDLVALAQYVSSADNYTKATVGGKLELISEQIKALQAQARRVLEEAQRDVQLNHAKCNFQRQPGQIYHLYRRVSQGADGEEAGTSYFSMLSPAEWGHRRTDEFLGSYRLEADMSWTPLEKVQEREQRRRFDANLLGVRQRESDAAVSALSITME